MTTETKPFVIVPDGYSRKKTPDTVALREMSVTEAQQLESGREVWFVSRHGTARRCKINGRPRVWKTRPNDVEIPLKYGMYEYGTFSCRNGVWGADRPMAIAHCADCGECPDSRPSDPAWLAGWTDSNGTDDLLCPGCAKQREENAVEAAIARAEAVADGE